MKLIMKKVAALALAFATLISFTAPAPAWDRGERAGVIAGIIGLGVLGAAAAAEEDRRARYYGYYDRGYYAEGCHPGPLVCREVTPPCFHNDIGDLVCPAPRERCFRRPVCD